MIKNRAFTLAEVLLVVVIIGTVAALTIPNLGKSYDTKATYAKAKKEYAAIDAAFSNIDVDRLIAGLSTDKDKSEAIVKNAAGSINLNEPALKNYLSIANYCGNKATTCFASPIKVFTPPKTVENGEWGSGLTNNCYFFQMNDGADVAICYKQKKEPGVGDVVVYIVFDVNGRAKGPNYLNYDIFYAYLLPDNSLYFSDLEKLNDPENFD